MDAQEKIEELGGSADPIRRFLEAYLEGYYDAAGYLDNDEEIEEREVNEENSLIDQGYGEGWNRAIEIFEKTAGYLK